MDVIETIKKDKAYIKCKLIVKNWEIAFKAKHSRTPSKYDIKEAPPKIKYAYKKYFQMKSAALDSTFSVCDLEEETEVASSYCSPESFNLESLATESLSPPSHLESMLPSTQELEKILSDKKAESNIQSKIATVKSACRDDNPAVPQKPPNKFVKTLSQKLFGSRTFSFRNPRKIQSDKSVLSSGDNSLLSTNNDSSGLTNDLQDSCVPDFEDISSIISVPAQLKGNITYSSPLSMEQTTVDIICTRSLNKEWLERNTNFDKTPDLHASLDQKLETKVSTIEKVPEYIENSDSEPEDILTNKLKPALKKRKIMSPVKYKPTKHKTDLIEPTRNKKKNMSQIELVDSELPPDIQEFLPLGFEQDITPRYTDVTQILNHKNTTVQTKLDDEFVNPALTRLEKKIQSGTLNDNYVKINIEKKVYVRGKKGINYSKYKKKQYKDKKALNAIHSECFEGGKVTCFKCGQTGHMARYCSAHKGDSLLPLDVDCEDDIPTLADMEKFVDVKQSNVPSCANDILDNLYQPAEVPESFLQLLSQSTLESKDVSPLYNNWKEKAPDEVYSVLNMLGHKEFRVGQEEAVMRVLSGMSTLLVLSTGGGKSLCYQIPAYIYSQYFKCITLVISPLVSLMEDQVLRMPPFLKAGCLHTNQSPTQRKKIIQCLKDGLLNILLISPEALISGDTSSGFAGFFKSLPPIAFACIDEAHCVSYWSHNFRPSYLMICRVLREKLKVKCILGLTATASKPTIESIIDHLHIPDRFEGVITSPALPDNLVLSMSLEKNKDRALVSLLTSDKFCSFNSIIVYCIRRDECERVAAVLRSSLQETGKKSMESNSNKRKRMSYIAEAYHAGMSAAQRKKIQNHFMDGSLKIIVATVAFGMGINKPDIRCIIHYNMPSSFESYVQEVGRAGRDGKVARCHVFISNESHDVDELLKHIYSNSIDRPSIRKLLQKTFVPCQCKVGNKKSNPSADNCKGHEIGIPIDETVEQLDVPAENIVTMLCYLELHAKNYIKVLNNAYIFCKVMSYSGPEKILQATKTCPALAMAYVLESKRKKNVLKESIFEFNVIEAAAAIGWDSGLVKYHLKNLEWHNENGVTRRSPLKVEFHMLGFRIKAPGDLSPNELDDMLDDLHKSVENQEKAKLSQLNEIRHSFKKLSDCSVEEGELMKDESVLYKKSEDLKEIIRHYFQRQNQKAAELKLPQRPLNEECVAADVCSLVAAYKDCNFTGRSIARIFQGISSPNYPALVWGRCKFWRSHLHEDFNGIVRIASQQLLKMRLNY